MRRQSAEVDQSGANERPRKRRLERAAHLLQISRDFLQVGGQCREPLVLACVFARYVDAGAQAPRVPGRVAQVILRHLHAEQHALDGGKEMTALKVLFRTQGFHGKLFLRPLGVLPQHVAALANRPRAHVRKLPVEFVAAGPHGARRLGGVQVVDEFPGESFPPGFGNGHRLLLRRLSAASRNRTGRRRQGGKQAKGSFAQVHENRNCICPARPAPCRAASPLPRAGNRGGSPGRRRPAASATAP